MIILSDKTPPLHRAAAMGYIDKVKRLIADEVCIINISDENGNTALHFAAVCDETCIAHFLIRAGANPHKCNCSVQTPLDIAINNYGKDSEIARILREAMEKQGG